jgi:mRNA interferase MazF
MKKLTVSYKPSTVVRVPFPFVDSGVTKFRPALVLSNEEYNLSHGHCLMAMITSAKHSRWPSDVILSKIESTGLSSPSVVRFKLFTLDNRLIANAIGKVDGATWIEVLEQMRKITPTS